MNFSHKISYAGKTNLGIVYNLTSLVCLSPYASPPAETQTQLLLGVCTEGLCSHKARARGTGVHLLVPQFSF